MITADAEKRILVATKPVDVRKQADGLPAIVQAALGADPFCLRVPPQEGGSRQASCCVIAAPTIP
jgi:hypothetical protein